MSTALFEKRVKAYFDVLHAVRQCLRGIPIETSDDLQEFWIQNFSAYFEDENVVIKLRQVFDGFGAEVPLQFPKGPIRFVVEECIVPDLFTRLLVLFYRRALDVGTVTPDRGPDAILEMKFQELFSPGATADLREVVLRCVDGDFTRNKSLNWSSQTVKKVIEEILS